MQITRKRVITAVVLTTSTITTYQLLSKPQPIAEPQPTEQVRQNAQAFDQKLEALEAPKAPESPPVEVRFTSDEVSAEMAESSGAVSPPPGAATPSPNAPISQGDVQIKGYQVKLDGNVARGQFLAQIAGKDVYITLAGHLGSQGGYVTFDPTEFKIGELSIPVSLVNTALQKKLAEQRDQLKLPDGISSLRVEDGQLVITRK
jgi:hypothetical protein